MKQKEGDLLYKMRAPLPASSSSSSSSSSVISSYYDAIVIGAGWSGLSAAATLVDNEYDNILVLEARDRIGGRSHTVTDFFVGPDDDDDDDDESTNTNNNNNNNIPVELGCEFIYPDCTEKNEIVDIFDRNDIPYTNIDNTSTSTSYAIFTDTTDGKMDDHITEQLDKRLYDGFLSYVEQKQKQSTCSSSSVEDVDYGKLLRQYKVEENIDNEFDIQYLNMLMNDFTISYAADPTTLSVRSTLDDMLDKKDTILGLTSVPNGGNGLAIEKFVNNAGIDDKIKINCVVKSIDYTQNKNDVIVTYTNNKADANLLIHVKAPVVLVTVPLGVLKAGLIQFTPVLPKYKREAIDTMQVGTLNKYILYWDDATMTAPTSNSFRNMWDSIMDRNWFSLVTTQTETSDIFTSFFNSRAHNGGKYVLTSWIAGFMAEAMEALDDDDAVLMKYAMPNLRSIFGSDDVPLPTKSVMTRWRTDKYSLGSYSYRSVHVNFEDVANALGSTIDNKLFFAGEHTSPDDWGGTTVGAYQTGEDAAESMLDVMSS